MSTIELLFVGTLRHAVSLECKTMGEQTIDVRSVWKYGEGLE
jgi:hypothetical protein